MAMADDASGKRLPGVEMEHIELPDGGDTDTTMEAQEARNVRERISEPGNTVTQPVSKGEIRITAEQAAKIRADLANKIQTGASIPLRRMPPVQTARNHPLRRSSLLRIEDKLSGKAAKLNDVRLNQFGEATRNEIATAIEQAINNPGTILDAELKVDNDEGPMALFNMPERSKARTEWLQAITKEIDSGKITFGKLKKRLSDAIPNDEEGRTIFPAKLRDALTNRLEGIALSTPQGQQALTDEDKRQIRHEERRLFWSETSMRENRLGVDIRDYFMVPGAPGNERLSQLQKLTYTWANEKDRGDFNFALGELGKLLQHGVESWSWRMTKPVLAKLETAVKNVFGERSADTQAILLDIENLAKQALSNDKNAAVSNAR
jgi:hypothetical protein